MIAVYKKSRKMPTLNSYFLSGFGSQTLEELKSSKPFSAYWKDTQEYECTRAVYEKVKQYEPNVQEVTSVTKFLSRYERKSKEKYGYQDDAVEFAMGTDNIFLNFPQGMGKSFTTMKILKARRAQKVLIICGQSNLQEEWLKDAVKHNMAELLNMGIVGKDSGAGTPKKMAYLLEKQDCPKHTDLINIEALRNTDIVFQLNQMQYDCIVVDEVQSAKGWKAEQTQGLHELIRLPGQIRIALSGTPILNNPLEFFSFLKFFGLLDDTARTTFEKYYGNWTFDYWGHYVCTGYKNLEDLAELLRPVLCWADKAELKLIPKRRKRISIEWDAPEEYYTLQKYLKLPIKRLKKVGYESKAAVRSRMQYLSSTAQPKLDFLLSLSDPENKVLIFSEYTTVLDKIYNYLIENGEQALLYTGKLSMKQRLEVLEKWRRGEADYLLLSVGASRYGLNLTEATRTVELEPPDSLSILEQIEDRAWRIGQTKEVISYLLETSQLDTDGLSNIETKQRNIDELFDLIRNIL